VFVADVLAHVEISVVSVTTRTTTELALAPAAAPRGEAAGITALARVPGINPEHAAAQSLGLVFEERAQLSERPRVQPALGVAARGFDAGSDVRQVFHNNGHAWSKVFQDVRQDGARENMVAIPSEAHRASREEPKAAAGRLGSFGLQLATKAEAAFLDLAPLPFAVKSVVRGHGGAAGSRSRSSDWFSSATAYPTNDNPFFFDLWVMMGELFLLLKKKEANMLLKIRGKRVEEAQRRKPKHWNGFGNDKGRHEQTRLDHRWRGLYRLAPRP
jgi:hypothetical protein